MSEPETVARRARGARWATSRADRPRLTILVLSVGIVLLLLAVEPLRVTSQSMSPGLNAGDHVFVARLFWRDRPPGVGDLVVFRDPERRALVVKRVVALGGQTVALEDARLVVDGMVRDEPDIDHSRIDSTYFGPVTVPPGTVFVMGDNRGESIDSRTYGPIELEALLGRVLFTVTWP